MWLMKTARGWIMMKSLMNFLLVKNTGSFCMDDPKACRLPSSTVYINRERTNERMLLVVGFSFLSFLPYMAKSSVYWSNVCLIILQFFLLLPLRKWKRPFQRWRYMYVLVPAGHLRILSFDANESVPIGWEALNSMQEIISLYATVMVAIVWWFMVWSHQSGFEAFNRKMQCWVGLNHMIGSVYLFSLLRIKAFRSGLWLSTLLKLWTGCNKTSSVKLWLYACMKSSLKPSAEYAICIGSVSTNWGVLFCAVL